MMVSQLIYYSTQFSLDNIGESIYVNAIIVGAGEMSSYVLIAFFVEKLPRKTAIIGFMLSCNILCLL